MAKDISTLLEPFRQKIITPEDIRAYQAYTGSSIYSLAKKAGIAHSTITDVLAARRGRTCLWIDASRAVAPILFAEWWSKVYVTIERNRYKRTRL